MPTAAGEVTVFRPGELVAMPFGANLPVRLDPGVMLVVNASSKVLGLIGLTVGAALGGVLASSLSLSVPFMASGALFICCGAIVWWLFRSELQSGSESDMAPEAARID